MFDPSNPPMNSGSSAVQTTDEWKREFRQDGDTYSSVGPNYIVVSRASVGVTDAGALDDGYYVIETERWAIDDIDELIALLIRAGVPPPRIDHRAAPTPEVMP